MGTVTARAIIESAQKTLLDETGVRWTPEELMTYLSDGQREIVKRRPSALPVNGNIQLVAGTKQSIPSIGQAFIKAVRNMGANGTTPGRAVWWVDQMILNRNRPNWHAETPSAEVKHYMFDPLDPRHFYVTPPQPASGQGQLEIIYSGAPVEIDDLDTTIEVDDRWSPDLNKYVMSRALAKDSGEGDPNGAINYYKLFLDGVPIEQVGPGAPQ